MSKLNVLIAGLIKVIIGYHDIKTGIMQPTQKLRSIDEFLKMEPHELNTAFTQLIASIAKTKESRVNYFEYLTYIIQTIKPLLDHEQALSSSEIDLINDTLTHLIIYTQQLHPLSHNSQVLFKYKEKTISAYGFQAGILRSTLCLTGELMQRYFPDYYLVMNPTEYPAHDIQAIYEQTIAEHQQGCYCSSLRQQNDLLKQQIELFQKQKSTESPQAPLRIYSPLHQNHLGVVGLLPPAHRFFSTQFTKLTLPEIQIERSHTEPNPQPRLSFDDLQ